MGGIIFNDDSIIGMMAWHVTGGFFFVGLTIFSTCFAASSTDC